MCAGHREEVAVGSAAAITSRFRAPTCRCRFGPSFRPRTARLFALVSAHVSQWIVYRRSKLAAALVDLALKRADRRASRFVQPPRLASHFRVAEQRIREPRKY